MVRFFFFFFWRSWIQRKVECKRNLAGLVWWEIKNVLHVRVRTCKYAISGLKMVRFEFFFSMFLLSPFSSWFQVFVSGFISGFISGFKHCILLTPNSLIEVMKLILSKHFTNNSTKMPKLSKRQLQSLQENLGYRSRFQKKRPVTNVTVGLIQWLMVCLYVRCRRCRMKQEFNLGCFLF